MEFVPLDLFFLIELFSNQINLGLAHIVSLKFMIVKYFVGFNKDIKLSQTVYIIFF